MKLPHRTPDCTGTWHWEPQGPLIVWRCGTCRELAFPSTEVSRALIQENLLGEWLDRLTEAGQELLEEERSGP